MAPLLFALLAISVQSLPATGVDLPVTIRGAVEAAAERVKPALVRIHVVSTDYSGGREIKSESTGSGDVMPNHNWRNRLQFTYDYSMRMATMWDSLAGSSTKCDNGAFSDAN